MKTRGIGEVSRGGGFPRVVKDVLESQEPLLIMKNNEPAVVIIPAGFEALRVIENLRDLRKMLLLLSHKIDGENDVSDLEVYILSQILGGIMAKSALSVYLKDDSLQKLEQDLVSGVREISRKIFLEQVIKVAEKNPEDGLPFLEQIFGFSQKNSPQGPGSVSPMTTGGGGVSEVKNEELPFGSSSLPGKRGRPKKLTSSPQKRKIGTKREKSA